MSADTTHTPSCQCTTLMPHPLVPHPHLHRTLYEPHAFLLDQDRASTLPNMAAGNVGIAVTPPPPPFSLLTLLCASFRNTFLRFVGLSSVVFSITFDAQYLDSPRRFVEVESHETATVATSPHESSDCASTPDENDDGERGNLPCLLWRWLNNCFALSRWR